MIYVRSFAVATCVLLFGTVTLYARDLSRYREFQLGSTLVSVQKSSGTTASDVRVIHQRPAVIQELRWRPPLGYTNTMEPTEPVREAIFTFYNDQLFQIVVDYDRQRTEGLTDADLIEAISGRYGIPALTGSPLPTEASPSVMSTAGAIVVAQWSDAEASMSLVRGTYPTTLRLVMVLKSVEALARAAAADALRQDREEAPQREIDRMHKIAEDGRVTAEKARVANKPRFKP